MNDCSNLSETLNYVRNLDAGNHGVFFYASQCEKHQVLFNFLQAGVQKGEGVIYVSSQETSKQIRRHMKNFGLDIKSLEKDGVLKVFDYSDWYIINGEVNCSHTIRLGMRLFYEMMQIGLKGLRGCGEAACFFEHEKGKELLEYELSLGRKTNFPMTALCAYDVNHAKSLSDRLFFDLIKAHGPVITSNFAQEVKFENLFPQIMDEVIETVFGSMGKQTILTTLEKKRSLSLQNIGENSNDFIDELEKILGSGAQVMTKLAAQQMHSEIGITQSERH
ncbi:MAG: MEDS domain-containing protein [Candidatus Bathyarchaeota archaeon]|nr:MEDS domain-containing protein [Candidatus Bathyarchaeota archaeon]MDH5788542.1 MEDS domain-containing protein [Candidatus Bathyarchaeota archaeon]